MINVIFISVHPAPYRDPFFALLSQQPNVRLKVYHLFNLDKGHDFWNLPPPPYVSHIMERGIIIGKFKIFHPEIIKLLLKEKYDIIVTPGFIHYTTVFILIYCALFRKKYVLTFDTVAEKTNSKKIRKYFYKHAAAFFVPGKASEQYLLRMGIPLTKILHGAYDLDKREICLAMAKEDKIKNRLCFDIQQHSTVFLMVANMTPNRDYPILFKAFYDFNQKNPDSFLLVVGSGVELTTINDFCDTVKLNNFKIILSSSYGDLAKYYAVADWYIHTGSEPYSTAVKYAAIAGIPIISSYSIGASYDYIKPDKTGIIVDNPKDAKAWSDAMEVACNSDSACMGKYLKESTENTLMYHVEQFANFILTRKNEI